MVRSLTGMKQILGHLLAAFVLASCSQVAADVEGLNDWLEETREARKMPGFRAAIRYPDGDLIAGSVGLADKKSKTPLDNQIGMPGGSTGKTFVAVVAMRLVEEGVIRLDDRAQTHLGDTDWYARLPNAATIEVRHLLSHSAGIADYANSGRARFASIWRVLRRGSIQFEPEELIGFVLDREPFFPAGQGFHYTDPGYLVLGRLLERASGRTYYDLVREMIIEPYELDDIRPADRSILTNIATGYTAGAANLKRDGRMKYDPSSEWTGGGLVTTPEMLVRFFGDLVEGNIVQPQTLERMMQPVWRNPQSPTQYGLGLFIFDGGLRIGHGGLWPGYRTHVIHNVETGITTAIQTNRDGGLDMHRIATELESLAHRRTR